MKKNLLRAAKLVLSVAVLWVLYRYFFKIDHPNAVWLSIRQIPLWVYLIGCLSAAINWGIEARKWQVIVRQLEQISYYKAIKSTCAGAAVSNLFPFKVGEYLGRIIFIEPENRIPAAFNSALGSTMQLFCSILFGIPAAYFILPEKHRWIASAALIALILIPIVLFFVFRYFQLHTFQSKWLKKLAADIRQFTFKQLLHVLWLSALRYATFASFYVFLLFISGISTSVLTLYAGVAATYLLQSFAPGMVITDAGFRTAIPLIVFQVPENLQAALIAAALVNYVLNIMVPSLSGLFFILAYKIKTR